jgi:hypothetical protein
MEGFQKRGQLAYDFRFSESQSGLSTKQIEPFDVPSASGLLQQLLTERAQTCSRPGRCAS